MHWATHGHIHEEMVAVNGAHRIDMSSRAKHSPTNEYTNRLLNIKNMHFLCIFDSDFKLFSVQQQETEFTIQKSNQPSRNLIMDIIRYPNRKKHRGPLHACIFEMSIVCR